MNPLAASIWLGVTDFGELHVFTIVAIIVLWEVAKYAKPRNSRIFIPSRASHEKPTNFYPSALGPKC